MVRHRHLVGKPTGNHLSPRCPGLQFLVHHRGIAAEEDSRDCRVALYPDALHGRTLSVELQCQQIIPVQVVMFTRLQRHLSAPGNLRRTFVHDKRIGGKLFFLRDAVLHEESSRLGAHHRMGWFLLVTQRDGYLIVAVGHRHGEVERFRLLTVQHTIDNHLRISTYRRKQ